LRFRAVSHTVEPALREDERDLYILQTPGGPQRLIIDLSASADVIAQRIFHAVPAAQADAIVRALNARLAHWRCGSCDLHLLLQRR